MPYRDAKPELARTPPAESAVAARYQPLSFAQFQQRTGMTAAAFIVVAGGLMLYSPTYGVILGPMTALLGFLWWKNGRRRALAGRTGKNAQGLALLAARDYAGAARVFEELIDGARSDLSNHAIFVMNRAVAHLHLGEIAAARSLFRTVQTVGILARRPQFATQNLILHRQFGFTLALAGDLDEAERMVAAAARITSADKAGMLVAARATICLRRGDAAGALARLVADWSQAEAILPTTQMKVLRILRAFAVSLVDKEAKRGDEIERLIDGARPFPPGEVDFLAAEWPELAAFFAERGVRARTDLV